MRMVPVIALVVWGLDKVEGPYDGFKVGCWVETKEIWTGFVSNAPRTIEHTITRTITDNVEKPIHIIRKGSGIEEEGQSAVPRGWVPPSSILKKTSSTDGTFKIDSRVLAVFVETWRGESHGQAMELVIQRAKENVGVPCRDMDLLRAIPLLVEGVPPLIEKGIVSWECSMVANEGKMDSDHSFARSKIISLAEPQKIGARSVPCVLEQVTIKDGKETRNVKRWLCSEILGHIARAVIIVSSLESEATITREVVGFETKP